MSDGEKLLNLLCENYGKPIRRGEKEIQAFDDFLATADFEKHLSWAPIYLNSLLTIMSDHKIPFHLYDRLGEDIPAQIPNYWKERMF